MRKIISYLLISVLLGNIFFNVNLIQNIQASENIPSIESPVFNEDGTVTVNVLYEGETLYIIGNFQEANNWGTFIPMLKGNSYDIEGVIKSVFSYTFSLNTIKNNKGEIQYKFSNVDNWSGDNFTDPLNANIEGGNSKLDYLKLDIEEDQLQQGSATSIKAIRMDMAGVEINLTEDTTFQSSYEKVTVTSGQVVVMDIAEIGTSVTITGNYNGVEATTVLSIVDQPLQSPIVTTQGSVTFSYQGNGTQSKVAIAGGFNGWSTEDTLLVKGENNIWSTTLDLSPGSYEYKFVVDGSWIADPLNELKSGDNSLVIVDGIQLQLADEIALGKSVDLTANYLNKEGESSSVDAQWSLKEAVDGVSLTNNQLTVADSATVGGIVTVIATYDGMEAEHNFTLIGQTYEFTIHYYRHDKKQMEWDLWVWMDGKDGAEYDFTNEDEDGYATVTITVPESNINIITRPGNWSSQEVTRIAEISEGESVDVWIIEGDEKVYYDKSEIDISSKVESALMDSTSEITVYTTSDIGDDVSFRLKDGDGAVISTTMFKNEERKVTLTLSNPEDIDVRELYTVESDHFGENYVTMRGILDDSQFYYSGDDLGVTYKSTQSMFKVWAPTAKEVYVSLYDDVGIYDDSGKVTDHTGGQENVMVHQDNGIWSVTIENDLAGKYYMYKVVFTDGKVNYAVDPYANAVSANGQRAAIIDMGQTNPSSFTSDYQPPIVNPTDAVIYELQVRDFSINDNSGITNKGKYKAFTEVGTNYNGISTGIDSLEELGVTHVHLLPVYDFATVNELKIDDSSSDDPKFNWGYDPQNYNVPEGSYSTNPEDPSNRIIEFKEMVQSLHDKDIGVVMDVVYNHTFNIEDSNFDKIVPGYYHRTDEKGTFTNGSGVGNEIASERPMVSKYIIDSVIYWAEEYGIDGFRFDLMKLIDINTVKQLENRLHNEVDPSIIIYGEPWSGGSTPLSGDLQIVKGTQKDNNFAVFNDNLRGAIKGGSDDASKGFATGATGNESGIVTGVKGAIDDFTNSPTETINYVTAHDNLNLWDKVIKTQGLEEQEGFVDIKDGELQGEDANSFNSVEEAVAAATPHSSIDEANVLSNETVKRSLLANGIIMTSQGIPFIHAGDEILRTKFGDHNSYRSPDAINMLRWEDKAKYDEVFDYYEGLIDLRQAHPAFRMTDKDNVYSNINVFIQEDSVVAYALENYANNDIWKNIVVIYNGNEEDKIVTLPSNRTWYTVVNGERAGTEIINSFTSDQVSVEGLTMMVLYDEVLEYTPVATSLELSHEEIGLEVGEQQALTAIVKDQEERIMDIDISFNSGNASIATVSDNGLIKAISEGDVNIEVVAGNLNKTITVHVGDRIPTTVEIIGDSAVYETYTINLNVDIKDQYDQIMTGESISWSSSNDAIATVSQSGKVTGKAKGVVTITAHVEGVIASKTITVKENATHYVRLQYVREDEVYDDWNLWVWNTGVQDDQIDYAKIEDGKAIFNIKVTPFTSQIGFIVRKGTDWSTAKQDITNDRFIDIFENEIITKVTAISMQQDLQYVKEINGPELNQGKATFYFRDPDLFATDNMDTIDGVMLNIMGNSYEMVYQDKDELFEYTFETVPEGVFEYNFNVTIGSTTTTVSDVYNLNAEGQSIFTYDKLDLSIDARLSKAAVNYNENTVLTLTIKEDDVDIRAAEIVIDVSAIGGDTISMEPSLNEVTLAVKDDVAAGIKEIPITVIDEFGGYHQVTSNIEILPRSMNDNDTVFDFDEARIYFMLTDRFNNADMSNDDPYEIGYDKNDPGSYHGGDFKGVTDKLDYLDDLGINTIWITPIVDNINYDVRVNDDPHITPYYGYHGYWADNFEVLNPHLGTIEDFHTLIDEAHKRNMKIMVDVVLNHSGYGLKSNDTANGIEQYPTDEDRKRFEGLLRENPVDGDPVLGELSGLPDFKTEDEAVRDQIIEWQVNWVKELGMTSNGNTVDYFRVDTVKHVDDTTWMAFKNELTKDFPEFKMIGESFGASPEDSLGDLGNGKMDALLDFSFNDKAREFVNGDVEGVEEYLELRNQKVNNTFIFGQFLSSHDEDGFLTMVENDLGKQKIGAALQITAKGQPVIYYGEELGLGGTSNNPYYDNRYDFPWEQVENNDMLEHYTKLLNIRQDNSLVFSKGDRTKVEASNDQGYVLFERSYKEEKVLIGLNTKEIVQEVTFDNIFTAGTLVKDLYNNNLYKVDQNNRLTILMPDRDKGGTIILKKYTSSSSSNSDDDDDDDKETDEKAKDDAIKQEEQIIKTDDIEKSLEVLNGSITVTIAPETFEDNYTKLVVAIVDDSKDINEEAYINIDDTHEFVTPIYEFDLKDQANKKVNFKKPIKIELKYDPEKVKDPRKLGVYYFNEQTKEWEYVGGIVSENGTISFEAQHFSKYTVMESNKTFKDLNETAWAKDAIEVLASKEIINGVDKDYYEPSRAISKAEFAQLLVKAFDLESSNDYVSYHDVNKDDWYYDAVRIASGLEIVVGYEGEFHPNKETSREEMAVMLLRTLEALDENLEGENNQSFKDDDEISDWATKAVMKLIGRDIITGTPDGYYYPQNSLTRAEAAIVIYKALYE
ncbi:type I pullulanase [Vallitalea okinawensis]|uniref:type I pullulanase n=1 Tax=Vallitalea okinawensis TaxID=2078660 RepID=UPI00147844C2|nr:type I pullulanase [Vallitalea okinawensis]